MSYWPISFLIFLFFYIERYSCITNGRVVQTEKGFVVYLLKAPSSPKRYIAWMCGGAIISNKHILTSAMCISDVQHVYVISGYNKYVSIENIDKDECTKRKKRKIIHMCAPYSFWSNTFQINYWNWADIAVAIVDVPFDFTDHTYIRYCSYLPSAITINMQEFWEKSRTDVLAYGWGSAKYQRPENDTRDYNERYLRYSSGLISHWSESCSKHTSGTVFKKFNKHFNKYLICVADYGNIDERGEQIVKVGDLFDNCMTRVNSTALLKQRLSNKKQLCRANDVRYKPELEDPKLLKVPGICQNDHGGPLTTWRGGKEILIGVATLYIVTQKMECRAPYGFTSTYCNNKFIACRMWPGIFLRTRRSLNCNATQYRRYGSDVVEKNISWINHPDGPAETEIRRAGPRNHGYDRI